MQRDEIDTVYDTKEVVEAIILNDPANTFLLVVFDDHNDEELGLIFRALKQNTAVEKLCVMSRGFEMPDAKHPWDLTLGVKASLALFSALMDHPSVKHIWFDTIRDLQGLSAIATAIRHNQNLLSLKLVCCKLYEENLETLDWLLSEDALEDLELENCFPEDILLHLPQGLASNTSLKRIRIECYHEEDFKLSPETLDALVHQIRSNTNLQEVRLAHFDIPLVVLERIAEALSSRESTLAKLSLVCIGLDGTDLGRILGRMLASNAGLKGLEVRDHLGDTGGAFLSDGLRNNTTLETLELDKDWQDPRELFGNDGGRCLAQSLVSNNTLRTLEVHRFSGEAMNDMALYISRTKGLRSLSVWGLEGFAQHHADALLEAMKSNSTLQHARLYKYGGANERDFLKKINYQMALICGGAKRLITSSNEGSGENEVAKGLWPLILERSSNKPDVLFFFLQEKHDVLINKIPPPRARESRKRKRDWLTGWFW